MTHGRRVAAGALALALALALACVAVRDGAGGGAALLARPAAHAGAAQAPAGRRLDGAQKQSFARWYEQQSAAAWFGDDTMPRHVQVGSEQFKATSNKAKWLTKQDVKGIPAVLQAKRAKMLKREAVQLAMARLAAKDRRGGLAKALKQQLAGYGAVAELRRLAAKTTPAAAAPAGAARTQQLAAAKATPAAAVPAGAARTQQLLQLPQLADADAEQVYRPIETEGDGPDLEEGRVLSIVKDLETKFLNRSTGAYAANRKHHEEKTPEEKAAEKAAEDARKAEEAKTEAVMASAGPKLQAILNKQMKLKTEQADKLSELRTKLNDVLDPQGYTDADITQCGDHCAEVQIAAEHQAEILRQRKDAEREEEDRELNVPLGTRR